MVGLILGVAVVSTQSAVASDPGTQAIFPIRKFGDRRGRIDLKDVRELVINFSTSAIPPGMRDGTLAIQSIVVTRMTGQAVSPILSAQRAEKKEK